MKKMKLQEIELGMSPLEVARGLEHLGGLVFFDSSGNIPSGYGEVISVVAARPSRILVGNVSDMREVDEVISEREIDGGGLPCGGVCGWVEYEGGFVFGVYDEMLIYRHDIGVWAEVGELSKEIREVYDEGDVEVGEFREMMKREEYVRKVEQIREYIKAGDIYQVNLCQKFEAEVSGDGNLLGLYDALRGVSPSPLGGYISLDGREVLSSSPETFLKMSGCDVETRPIKGTRPRFEDQEADLRSADELCASDKERAELVMITDLERNDLGQVCEYGSVRVEEMLKLERLAHVYHLVSTVRGELREGVGHVEVLQRCFPGGSITGAPKVRAMEIIEELESDGRGIYTGAMGYFGFGGESQFNIVIRTLVREGSSLHYHVGAGIVADSDAELEYEETLQKARGMQKAVKGF